MNLRTLVFIIAIITQFELASQGLILPNGHLPEPSIQGLSVGDFDIYGYKSTICDNISHDDFKTQNEQIISEAIADNKYWNMIQRNIEKLSINGFPSFNGYAGTEKFYSAYEKLEEMLTDSLKLKIEDAVFLIENAMLGGQLDFSKYNHELDQLENLCRWKILEMGLNQDDNIVKTGILFNILTEKTEIKIPGIEKRITHYTLSYNLDDYESKIEFTSHFVSTLLTTSKGQCYSFPLLYLIIAERLGAEAYLSMAPRHSFVKVKGYNNEWYNLELTAKYILSDAYYMNYSFIKSEGVKKGLYLSPLDKKEIIAYLVAQLGRYYLVKYGYDDFLLKCTQLSRKYMKIPIDALILEADYEMRLTLELAKLTNSLTSQDMKYNYPEAYIHYEKLHELYRMIDSTGYEETPPEVYQRWINYINKLKGMNKNSPIKELIN